MYIGISFRMNRIGMDNSSQVLLQINIVQFYETTDFAQSQLCFLLNLREL